jgi:hypothetical protein
MSKRGMSTLVASLILVTLCLVALVFVGITIKNSFKDDSNQLEVDQFTLDLEISQVQILNETDVEVTLKRNSKENELSGAAFVFYDEDDNEISRQNVSIKELEDKNFSVVLKVVNSTLIEKISIAPIFKKRFGKDVLGEIQDEAPLKVGTKFRNVTSEKSGGRIIGGSSSSGGTSTSETQNGVIENCSDGIQNQDETGIDCGGVCSPCIVEEGSECKEGYYLFNGVCLLNVTGNTYFVATWGNDSNNGSIDFPWETFQKAISMTHAGDISYFKGGEYYPTTYATHRAGLASWKGYGYDGTPQDPIRFFNYPGETPIFDNSNQEHLNGQRGIVIQDVDYAHYKGLTFRNVLPMPAAQCTGVWAINSTNITFEQMTAHGFHGHGFFASSESDDIYYLNCDSYNNNRGETTQASDGFNALLTDPTLSVYYKGCRAWGNSDDGFDMIYGGYAEFEDCWAFNIGPGDGNGFKIVTGLNQDVDPLMRKFTNCISAGNKASGFHENSYTGIFNMHLYNSLAYKNGFAGFYVPTTGEEYSDNENIYRNNIAYGNVVYEAVALRGHWVHDHNSWDSSVVFGDEEFVKLPEDMEELFAILSAPRQEDGSLPDLGDYFQLSEGSNLIDAGTVIPGYHCLTSGSHPGEDCREWYGSLPDLGPFESNY